MSQHSQSADVQDDLLALFEAVVPVTPSVGDYVKASQLKWPDYEDCMVALCAIDAEADFIVTRDEKGFARSMVPAISPTQLLEKMRRERDLVYEKTDL